MKKGDIVRIVKNRHPKIADVEYRFLGKNSEDNLTSINKGIALRPVTNKSNRPYYMSGDVINQKEENLELINH